MEHKSIFKKILALAMTVTMLFGMSLTVYADDTQTYTEDGTSTIQVTGTITSGYSIALPAAVTMEDLTQSSIDTKGIQIPVTVTNMHGLSNQYIFVEAQACTLTGAASNKTLILSNPTIKNAVHNQGHDSAKVAFVSPFHPTTGSLTTSGFQQAVELSSPDDTKSATLKLYAAESDGYVNSISKQWATPNATYSIGYTNSGGGSLGGSNYPTLMPISKDAIAADTYEGNVTVSFSIKDLNFTS